MLLPSNGSCLLWNLSNLSSPIPFKGQGNACVKRSLSMVHHNKWQRSINIAGSCHYTGVLYSLLCPRYANCCCLSLSIVQSNLFKLCVSTGDYSKHFSPWRSCRWFLLLVPEDLLHPQAQCRQTSHCEGGSRSEDLCTRKRQGCVVYVTSTSLQCAQSNKSKIVCLKSQERNSKGHRNHAIERAPPKKAIRIEWISWST